MATLVGTPLHKMGQEEGYELFPMPKQLGGSHSSLTAAALLRGTGVLAALEDAFGPLLAALGIPKEAASVVLIRPLSGSAALGAVQEVMRAAGADSRAARIACVISGASETILFTGSLYMGAAGARGARYAAAAALAAYIAGVAAAGAIL